MSIESLMLSNHLIPMWRAESLEKTLTLGKIEGKGEKRVAEDDIYKIYMIYMWYEIYKYVCVYMYVCVCVCVCVCVYMYVYIYIYIHRRRFSLPIWCSIALTMAVSWDLPPGGPWPEHSRQRGKPHRTMCQEPWRLCLPGMSLTVSVTHFW